MRIALGGVAALGLALFFQPGSAKAAACAAGCVQTVNGSAFSGTTVTATLPGFVAGHSIHVWYSLQPTTAAVSSVVCGAVTATLGATSVVVAGGGNVGVAIAPNVASGSITCTMTQNATISNSTLIVEEWADPTTTAFDGQNATATGGGTGTSLPCGSISPATSGDTIEAALFQYQNVAPTIAGYTFAQSGLAGSSFFFSAFKTGASTGAQNPTFVSGTNSFNNGVVCAAFTQGGGGGGTSGPSLLLMGVGQ